MKPRVKDLTKRQLNAFREKFGRDPGPNDPVFFDSNEDEPTPIGDLQEEILSAMETGYRGREAGRRAGREAALYRPDDRARRAGSR